MRTQTFTSYRKLTGRSIHSEESDRKFRVVFLQGLIREVRIKGVNFRVEKKRLV